MKPVKNNKLSLIQALRGLAALIVVIHHCTGQMRDKTGYEYLSNVFSVGWSGVDFFFVLSGFIIYYIHHIDIGKRERLTKYSIKRLIRIYPSYWIITVILIPMFLIVPSWGEDYYRSVPYILKSFLLFPQENAPVLGVGWTLVHEMFFYIVFGILIAFKPRFSIPLLTVWLVGILLNLIGIVDFTNVYFLNFVFNHYNVEFFFGVLSAHLVINNNIKLPFATLLIGLISFVLVWFGALHGMFGKGDSTTVVLYGLSGALIIVGASTLDKIKEIKVPKPMLFIGDASYAIYLSHFYIIIFLQKIVTKFSYINPLNNFVTTTLIAIVTVGCGCIFYKIIEKPSLNILRKKFLNNKEKKVSPKIKSAV